MSGKQRDKRFVTCVFVDPFNVDSAAHKTGQDKDYSRDFFHPRHL